MDFQKFTQKSIEAIQVASSMANEKQNAQIEQEHAFVSLLSQDGGFIAEIFKAMGINYDALLGQLLKRIDLLSKVSGGYQISVSNELNQALIEAEKQAKSMNDEYISVEHIMLGILSKPNHAVKEILNSQKISKDDFLKALINA